MLKRAVAVVCLSFVLAGCNSDSGTGLFFNALSFFLELSAQSPIAMASGNIDPDVPDTDIDIVVANFNSNTVSILTNSGIGVFTAGTPLGAIEGVGTNPIDVTLADFLDSDGDLDLAVANQGDGTISFFRNDGMGGFSSAGLPILSVKLAAADLINATPIKIAMALLDGDAHLDLIVLENSDGGGAIVYTGDSAGTFTTVTAQPTQYRLQVNAGVAVDFIITNIMPPNDASSTIDALFDIVILTEGGLMNFFQGQGTGLFNKSAVTLQAGLAASALAVGDSQPDGLLDIVTSDIGDNMARFFGKLGATTFNAVSTVSSGNAPIAVAFLDMSLDGVADIITANDIDDTVIVHLGDGLGGFAESNTFTVGGAPSDLITADFNADGRADIATADSMDNSISVILSR